MKSIKVDSVCNGTNLSSDVKTKLDDAKDGLRLAKSMAKDKNNVIPKIEQEIPFIENFCSTKTVEKEKQEGPAPTGDQYYKSQMGKLQRMTADNPTAIPDALKRFKPGITLTGKNTPSIYFWNYISLKILKVRALMKTII